MKEKKTQYQMIHRGVSLVLCLFMQTLFGGLKTVRLEAPEFTVSKRIPGSVISCDGYGSTGSPGEPRLPVRTVFVNLPENARNIQVAIPGIAFTLLMDRIELAPVDPLIASSSGQTDFDRAMTAFQENRENAYTQDGFFPREPAISAFISTRGNIPIVQLRFAPFRYAPLSGRLERIDPLTLTISYQDPESGTGPGTGTVYRNRSLSASFAANADRMLIVGPANSENQCGSFIFWKRCLGFEVRFVSIESVYETAAGASQAEQLRNFIRTEAEYSQISHVLLLGHRDVIPYVKLYPNPGDHGPAGGLPSDLYYAQLTGEWDTDHDGYPGEYGDDDCDRMADVRLGRIPFSDPATIGQILDKAVRFEQEHGAWKTSAVLMGAISNYKNENNALQYYTETDGAVLMEQMKTNLFSGSGITTLYEKEGESPSVYHCDLALNRDNVFQVWSGGAFGCLTWFSHGSYDALKRKWWRQDNGNSVPESSEIEWESLLSVNQLPVNPLYQPVIFANACDNGWPEKNSLARQLIQESATGIISASRETYASLGWNDVSDGGNASLTYMFWQNFTDGQCLAQALDEAKSGYLALFHGTWHHLSNAYAFNVFGDPSLRLTQTDPVYGGIDIQISADAVPEHMMLSVKNGSGDMFYQTDQWTDAVSLFPVGEGVYSLEIQAPDMKPVMEQVVVTGGTKTGLGCHLIPMAPPQLLTDLSAKPVTVAEGGNTAIEILCQNTGETTLTGIMKSESVWITCALDDMVIEPGQQVRCVLLVSAISLQSGTYHADILIETNDPQNPRCEIPVDLTVTDQSAPAAVQDLVLNQTNGNRAELSWTFSGDNGLSAPALLHAVFISDICLNGDAWPGARRIYAVEDADPGTRASFSFDLENPYIPAWFCVVVKDEAGNLSCSNVVLWHAEDVPVPGIQVSDASIRIQVEEWAETTVPLVVTNNGNAPLLFTCGKEAVDWLSIDHGSGQVAAGHCDTLLIGLKALSFMSGEYGASLTISSNAGQDTIEIPVVMDVQDVISPAPIEDLSLCGMTSDSLMISWSSTGDNGLEGCAAYYRLWAESDGSREMLMEITCSQTASGELIEIGLPVSGMAPCCSLQVEAVDEAGYSVRSNTIQISRATSVVSAIIPESHFIGNYPNPFNMETQLEFSINRTGPVSVRIYDAMGRTVCRLLDEERHMGSHKVAWNGLNANAQPVPSGVYVVHIQGPGLNAVRKMMLIK
ncbi:T9SS type A sorting domain-containing protein [bacterium]|nr:T9SS type A sorting domain-containing protein [bacterium]